MKIPKSLNKIPFKNTVLALLFANFLVIILVAFAQRFLPPVVPLFYGQPQGRQQLAKSIFLMFPPLIALSIVIVNTGILFFMKNDFLQKVQETAKKHCALRIFDEMVTGFRWALGGAQEYFKVTPDLACFSKAVSNGYPLSIISGKEEYMKRMDEIFVSMTFAGFTLGLVAAIETIKMMREFGDVHEHIHKLGESLINGGNEIATQNNLPIKFSGYGPHPVMTIKIEDDYTNRLLKSFIYQEMNKVGILFSASMMVGYAHQQEHIDFIMAVEKVKINDKF